MKTIRIFGRERKDTDGKSFIAFSYTKDGDTFYQVKFKKDCASTPKKAGYWLIDIEPKDCNIQKRKAQEGFKPNDVLWIDNCSNVRVDKDYENELRERHEKEMADFF